MQESLSSGHFSVDQQLSANTDVYWEDGEPWRGSPDCEECAEPREGAEITDGVCEDCAATIMRQQGGAS